MSEENRAKIIEEELYRRGFKPLKKVNLRLLMLMSLTLSIAGIIVIYVLAQQASAPYATIADVYGNYLMNYATVKVKGVVTDIPYFDNSTGKLSIRFSVNDETGSMNIYAYYPVSISLVSEKKIPFPGDNIIAEVQLRVRETYTYGILQIADLLNINSTTIEPPIEVSSLDMSLAWKNVRTEGTVASVRTVSTGILFEVNTGEAEIDVLLPNLLSYYNKDLFYSKVNSIIPGANVKVEGIVYPYKGSYPEILVKDLDNIEIFPPEKAVKASISELENYENKKVSLTVSLRILEYISASREYSLEVKDNTGKIRAIANRELLMSINPFDVIGNPVEVSGSVKREEGELTLFVEKITTLGSWSGETVKISDIDEKSLGLILAAEGEVRELSVRTTIVIFYLDDGSGSIKIFIPKSVYDDIKVSISEGSIITLAGYVYEYRGELEIVVFSPEGVIGG